MFVDTPSYLLYKYNPYSVVGDFTARNKMKKMKNMEQLKNLNFTEDDFKLMVDGLENLPEKGTAGNMMADLLGATMLKEGSPERDKFDRDRKAKATKEAQDKLILIEDIRILQGKLLTMKRIMIENNLLKEANDSLNS